MAELGKYRLRLYGPGHHLMVFEYESDSVSKIPESVIDRVRDCGCRLPNGFKPDVIKEPVTGSNKGK